MIKVATVELGSDPEAFLAKNGLIIGSEKVVPDGGIYSNRRGTKVVQDGVQVEFNLAPSVHRRLLGIEIGNALYLLRKKIEKMPNIEMVFDPCVTVTAEELASLSEKSRMYGCQPTYNAYGLSGADPETAKQGFRSAGGHIQLGLFPPIFDRNRYKIQGKNEDGSPRKVYDVDNRSSLVWVLDYIVGNTCVLFDRSYGAAQRRQNYGKAGEYRLPEHGLEYRTLSNFWLQSYQLFDFVFGLARLGVSIYASILEQQNDDMREALLDAADLDDVKNAIQDNDFGLALKNWNGIRKFIEAYGRNLDNSVGLRPATLDNFEYFIKMVEQKGLDYWFPGDPYESWLESATQPSWEDFLLTQVAF